MLQQLDRSYTQGIQLKLCQNFAELLLQGVANKIYRPPPGSEKSQNSVRRKDDSLAGCPNVPQAENVVENLSQITPVGQTNILAPKDQKSPFCPERKMEEIFLLLSIGETIGCKDAVLSRAEDHADAREK